MEDEVLAYRIELSNDIPIEIVDDDGDDDEPMGELWSHVYVADREPAPYAESLPGDADEVSDGAIETNEGPSNTIEDIQLPPVSFGVPQCIFHYTKNRPSD